MVASGPDEESGLAKALAWLKDYIHAIRHGRLHPFSLVERKARQATSFKQKWGPTGVQLNELAALSAHEAHAHVIFAVLEFRLMGHGENWRGVYKALQVLEFLARRGHPRCPDMCERLLPLLRCLSNFAFVGKDGKDYGANVRIRSAAVVALLEDRPGLDAAREALLARAAAFYEGWVERSPAKVGGLLPGGGAREGSAAMGDIMPGDGLTSRRLMYEGMPAAAATSGVGAAAAHAAQAASASSAPAENEKAAVSAAAAAAHAARLRDLLALPGNARCADCASPSSAARPTWASISCGVFLCMGCAGIHRGLGVHVSKVRSVALDTWTAAQVAAMEEAGGNLAANSTYWEARLDPTLPRPRDGPDLQRFIRSKYAQRLWAPPGVSWPPAAATSSTGPVGGDAGAEAVVTDAAAHEAPAISNAGSAALGAAADAHHAHAPSAPASATAGGVIVPLNRGTGVLAAAHAGPTTSAALLASAPIPAAAAPPPPPPRQQVEIADLLHLSDDDDEEGEAEDGEGGEGEEGVPGGPQALNPHMGVMEWLDAQHAAGRGLPSAGAVLRGPLSPAGSAGGWGMVALPPGEPGGVLHMHHARHMVASSNSLGVVGLGGGVLNGAAPGSNTHISTRAFDPWAAEAGAVAPNTTPSGSRRATDAAAAGAAVMMQPPVWVLPWAGYPGGGLAYGPGAALYMAAGPGGPYLPYAGPTGLPLGGYGGPAYGAGAVNGYGNEGAQALGGVDFSAALEEVAAQTAAAKSTPAASAAVTVIGAGAGAGAGAAAAGSSQAQQQQQQQQQGNGQAQAHTGQRQAARTPAHGGVTKQHAGAHAHHAVHNTQHTNGHSAAVAATAPASTTPAPAPPPTNTSTFDLMDAFPPTHVHTPTAASPLHPPSNRAAAGSPGPVHDDVAWPSPRAVRGPRPSAKGTLDALVAGQVEGLVAALSGPTGGAPPSAAPVAASPASQARTRLAAAGVVRPSWQTQA